MKNEYCNVPMEFCLPEDKKMIFSYGGTPELHIFPIFPSLKDLHENIQLVINEKLR